MMRSVSWFIISDPTVGLLVGLLRIMTIRLASVFDDVVGPLSLGGSGE